MKVCVSCSTHFASTQAQCPNCGFLPVMQDGYPLYAPEFATESSGFKANYFADLAQLEAVNFWFRSRNQLLLWSIRKYAPQIKSFLEIGCGTGYVLSGVAKEFPQIKLTGSEIFTAGLAFAHQRAPHASLMQMDAQKIPFAEEFDAIGAFDVIEHIENDRLVLTQIHSALKPNGYFFVTVPQHKWLWSAVDEYACHVRRYEATELNEVLQGAGFKIVRATSFVSTLLPAMLLSRLLSKNKTVEELDPMAELKINPVLNSIFLQILRFETWLIRLGVNFAMGGSRLVVAQKI